MSGCCSDCGAPGNEPNTGGGYRHALVVALILNLALFFVEIAGAWSSGSVSLLADAVDFLGDSVNFGASLVVISMGGIWASRLALAKGVVMVGWGLLVLLRAGWSFFVGGVPVHETMTWISLLALVTNLGVALLLYRHREGDANRKSVWLCARNDAFANLAVLAAAQGIAITSHAWPDLVAASVLAGLGWSSGVSVVRKARAELLIRRIGRS